MLTQSDGGRPRTGARVTPLCETRQWTLDRASA